MKLGSMLGSTIKDWKFGISNVVSGSGFRLQLLAQGTPSSKVVAGWDDATALQLSLHS